MGTPERKQKKRLGEILRSSGLINDNQLKKALDLQKDEGGLIGEVLMKLGFVSEIDIIQALTAQYGFPYMPVENYELDRGIGEVVPEMIARQHGLVPLDIIGDILTVVMSNPLNDRAVEDLEKLTGKNVQIFIGTTAGITGALNKLYVKK